MEWISIRSKNKAPLNKRVHIFSEIDGIDFAVRQDDGFWADDGGCIAFKFRKVTHWMPLPEPPKSRQPLKRRPIHPSCRKK